MFFEIIILISVLQLTNAKINLKVKVNSVEDIRVNFFGDDVLVVTEKEIKLFNFTKDNINRGMRVELGEVPDDVYLNEPTPYFKLFEKYKWSQTKRKMYVDKTKVAHVFKEPVIITVTDYINTTPDITKINVSVIKHVENTISSTWLEKGWPDENIFYDVAINFGNINLEYKDKWRSKTIKSIFLPFGVIRDGYIKINPNQTITSELKAFRTIVLIEISYTAKLIGNVIANYDHTYGNYHFWAPSVENIMKAANVTNEIKTMELIEIRCYTDPKLKIYDKVSAEEIEYIIAKNKPFQRRGKKKLSLNQEISSLTKNLPHIV